MDLPDRMLPHLLQPLPDAGTADLMSVTETIQRALSGAGLNSRPATAARAIDTVRQTLAAAGLSGLSAMAAPDDTTIPDPEVDSARPTAGPRRGPVRPQRAPGRSRTPIEEAPPGQFVRRSFASGVGSWAYKVYVPTRYGGEPVPVVVMLHGCTQSPDDFAAGTRMNALAEQHGFLAVYPAQPARANKSKCWNWFRATDQGRDTGEPAAIVGIVRDVAANYLIDQRRVFVAGLSAGGALAVILGATYPDVFAAVGIHSGLPYASAHDLPSALSAMKGMVPGTPRGRAPLNSPPTIVFHGDQDSTVHPRNGTMIVEQARACQSSTTLGVEFDRGATHGRAYSRTRYADEAGTPIVEHWVVEGAGHAWSGGSPAGSFTDVTGPDASAEMVRFFYAQRVAE